MSSIIPSDWDVIALFQKCNLKSAKLNYCARINLHRTQTQNFFTHISRNLFKGMLVLDSSKKEQQLSDNYPKPITQALISAEVPALDSHAHFLEWAHLSENTHVCSLY